MCSYLHRAPNGRYYFRMGIPANLRPFFDGKREIKQALNTADRETAKGLIPDFTSAARLSLNEARIALGVPAPSRPGEPALAVPKRPRTRREALADWDRDQVEFSEGPGSLEPEEWQEWVRQNTGKGLYLDTDILDGWAAERKPSAKGKDAYARSAKLFNTTMGRKSVELITKADVMAYKQKLIADPKRSQVNVRDHLAYIRTLFDWAAQEDIIPVNPAKDVRMRVTEKPEKRQDWNIDDLNALFAGPIHAEGHRPKDVRAGGDAAYWLPLLALFMGARREELGQLRVSDVRKAPYIDAGEKRQEVWCIDITDLSDDGEALTNQLKNASSKRFVPLHPKLIELGFIDYVQGLSDQRGRVFPMLTPDKFGKLTDKWGQWFTKYRRERGIASKLKVFHSLRHTWKTHAVDAGMAERICREFQGHEGEDVADKYGSAPSMRVLVEAIASYRVPGLVIPVP